MVQIITIDLIMSWELFITLRLNYIELLAAHHIKSIPAVASPCLTARNSEKCGFGNHGKSGIIWHIFFNLGQINFHHITAQNMTNDAIPRAIALLLFLHITLPSSAQQTADATFATAAAQAGMSEVKLVELALSSAGSVQVKEFDKKMVSDHGKANEELKKMAAAKKIQLPKALNDAKSHMFDSLAAIKGENFDLVYINKMIFCHEKTIGLFQTEASAGKDID